MEVRSKYSTFSPQFVVLALAAVQLSSAQDDGQYRPHLYGADDGSYRPSEHGYYQSRYSNYGSNPKYASIVYQPVVASPYGHFGFHNLNGFVNILVMIMIMLKYELESICSHSYFVNCLYVLTKARYKNKTKA